MVSGGWNWFLCRCLHHSWKFPSGLFCRGNLPLFPNLSFLCSEGTITNSPQITDCQRLLSLEWEAQTWGLDSWSCTALPLWSQLVSSRRRNLEPQDSSVSWKHLWIFLTVQQCCFFAILTSIASKLLNFFLPTIHLKISLSGWLRGEKHSLVMHLEEQDMGKNPRPWAKKRVEHSWGAKTTFSLIFLLLETRYILREQ